MTKIRNDMQKKIHKIQLERDEWRSKVEELVMEREKVATLTTDDEDTINDKAHFRNRIPCGNSATNSEDSI